MKRMTTEIRKNSKTVAAGGKVLPYLRRQLQKQEILAMLATTESKKAEAQRRAAVLRRTIARLEKTVIRNNIETPEG